MFDHLLSLSDEFSMSHVDLLKNNNQVNIEQNSEIGREDYEDSNFFSHKNANIKNILEINENSEDKYNLKEYIISILKKAEPLIGLLKDIATYMEKNEKESFFANYLRSFYKLHGIMFNELTEQDPTLKSLLGNLKLIIGSHDLKRKSAKPNGAIYKDKAEQMNKQINTLKNRIYNLKQRIEDLYVNKEIIEFKIEQYNTFNNQIYIEEQRSYFETYELIEADSTILDKLLEDKDRIDKELESINHQDINEFILNTNEKPCTQDYINFLEQLECSLKNHLKKCMFYGELDNSLLEIVSNIMNDRQNIFNEIENNCDNNQISSMLSTLMTNVSLFHKLSYDVRINAINKKITHLKQNINEYYKSIEQIERRLCYKKSTLYDYWKMIVMLKSIDRELEKKHKEIQEIWNQIDNYTKKLSSIKQINLSNVQRWKILEDEDYVYYKLDEFNKNYTQILIDYLITKDNRFEFIYYVLLHKYCKTSQFFKLYDCVINKYEALYKYDDNKHNIAAADMNKQNSNVTSRDNIKQHQSLKLICNKFDKLLMLLNDHIWFNTIKNRNNNFLVQNITKTDIEQLCSVLTQEILATRKTEINQFYIIKEKYVEDESIADFTERCEKYLKIKTVFNKSYKISKYTSLTGSEKQLFDIIEILMNGVKVYMKKNDQETLVNKGSRYSFNPFKDTNPKDFKFTKVIMILNLANDEIKYLNPVKKTKNNKNNKKLDIRSSNLSLLQVTKGLIPINTQEYINHRLKEPCNANIADNCLLEYSIVNKKAPRIDLIIKNYTLFTLIKNFIDVYMKDPKKYSKLKNKMFK